MNTKNLKLSLNRWLGKVPLKYILIVPFLIQIFGIVGLVGYLSYRNGQKTVADLSSQLSSEITHRIEERLKTYLNTSILINQLNFNDVKLGKLDLNDFQQVEQHFWEQIQIFDSVTYIYFGSFDEVFIGAERVRDGTVNIAYWSQNNPNQEFYTYSTDENGDRKELLSAIPKYNLLTRPWYRSAVEAKTTVWGNIYTWAAPYPNLALPCVKPLYTPDGTFEGVFAVDFSLLDIGEFLQGLEIGQNGQTFLMEKNGLLVATSSSDAPFVQGNQGLKRLQVSDLKNPLIQSTADYLKQQFQELDLIEKTAQFKFTLDGESQLVQVEPFTDELGLDWLIVVVVPEADFMEQIYLNNRQTVLLCFLALLVAITLGIMTARWVITPILKLNLGAKNIAQGKWSQPIQLHRQDELGELATAFNEMAQQLENSFATLEAKVKERTASLSQANQELEIAKEEAEVANQAKSLFIANMSHELRTPLNAILGFSQVMILSENLAPEDRENIEIIMESGEHLLSLINNILDMAKIEAGKMTFEPKIFNLHTFLTQLTNMFSLKVEEKGLKLAVDWDEDIPQSIESDEVKLRQVLINLINNGIKFTERGEVNLWITQQPPDWLSEIIIPASLSELEQFSQQTLNLWFQVQDTGVGIPETEIKTIFEQFGQTQSGKNTQEGTGLGLSISRKFIQLMGGNIYVHSILNQGTTFVFNIQVALPEVLIPKPPEPKKKIIALTLNSPQYKILIVDDKSANRKLLWKLLTPIGFELQEAMNGAECVQIWQQWQPDLILMDIRMPIMDGLEATEQIKQSPKGEQTKIIALTAHFLEEEKQLALGKGCDDFLRKPFREQEIFQKIKTHLNLDYIDEIV